jgi:ADP-ribose pyrophosphatase YjhB (NUDIX family)
MSTSLDLARRLLAISQTGLHFTDNVFERERYEEVQQIAAQLLTLESGRDTTQLLATWQVEDGYATPKIDVRGAVFRDARILLVRERSDGKWTMPGGWADVNEGPRQAVEKEILQESGYIATAVKIAAVHDRARRNYPAYLFHIWKNFFICDITGGEARTSIETDGVEFFPVNELPPLSTGRTTAEQVLRMYQHHLDRALPTDFD